MRLLKKIVLIAITLSVAQTAFAVTVLKKVEVAGSQLNFIFDNRVSKAQIKTEFINDIIQFSLQDVSVYPAKIVPVAEGEVTKVFAYQYVPRLVRARLSVKGKAEDFKNKLQISANGKILSIHVGNLAASDRLVTSSSQATHLPQAEAAQLAAKPSSVHPADVGAGSISADEKILLEKVLQSDAAPSEVVSVPPTGKVGGTKSESTSKNLGRSKASVVDHVELTAGRQPPSLGRGLGMMLLVLALFGAMAMAARKLMRGKGPDTRKLRSVIQRFAPGLAVKAKMIDVVQNHYLGPKKSIAVVRVCGRLMVLGITSENINLIAQLPGDATDADSAEAIAQEAALEGRVGDFDLDEFLGDEPAPKPAPTSRSGAAQSFGGPTLSTRSSAGAQAPAGASSAGGRITAALAARGAVIPGAARAVTAQYGAQANQDFATEPRVPQARFADVLGTERLRPSVRDQIKSKTEGLKPL